MRVHAVAGRTRETFAAPAAVIALPLGVLQAGGRAAGAVAIEPMPAVARDAIAKLGAGQVQRMVMLFRERVWEHARTAGTQRALRELVFVHDDDDPVFPVWWTPAPLGAPMLTGWTGGPDAERLPSGAALERRAIEALAHRLDASPRWLASRLVRAWTHDWSRDPFARAAYSYPLVGGTEAGQELAEPVERTLFFAGEACAPEGENGTVHGAIESGREAAKRVLEALRE